MIIFVISLGIKVKKYANYVGVASFLLKYNLNLSKDEILTKKLS
jgi:hypothetical protein